jgi:23S rRNA (guanosine2251-2'-O)-methyltransferase
MVEDMVHGTRAVEEALEAGGRVNRLLVAKESQGPATHRLIQQAKALGVPFDVVPLAKLNHLAGTGEHQGVAARVSPVEYMALDECLQRCPAKALLLVLDQVQHPRNLGMLIRTARGAGVSGVLLPQRGGALVDDTVVRASAGAVFHVPLAPCSNLKRAMGRLKEAGFWVYGLAGEGELDVFSVPWAERSALVMGNEAKGLRPSVLKQCDALVRIPLEGGLDSLNVAVAAGIALFQAAPWRAGL